MNNFIKRKGIILAGRSEEHTSEQNNKLESNEGTMKRHIKLSSTHKIKEVRQHYGSHEQRNRRSYPSMK